MSFFQDTPLISTSDTTIDKQCSVVFGLAVLVAIYYVWKAFQPADHYDAEFRRGTKHKRQHKAIWTFYGLALISFVTVVWLRTEHGRISLISAAEIREWQESKGVSGLWFIGREKPSIMRPVVKETTKFVKGCVQLPISGVRFSS